MKYPGYMSNSDFPPLFLERLQAILPATGYAEALAGLAGPRDTCFRLNPLHGDDMSDVLNELADAGIGFRALRGMDGVFRVTAGERGQLTRAGAVTRGSVYIQNPASMLAPLALAPAMGDVVLDLAAAPGSKTLQLAAMVGAAGRVSAVEVVKPRFYRLLGNLKRHGADNVQAYLKDGRFVWRSVPERFDKVLLDAPCSSEGQFLRSEPESFRYWRPKKGREMARKQKSLLWSAVQCLKPGGRLLYATCTFAPEENEVVIDHVMRKFPGILEIMPVDMPLENSQPGLTEWRDKPLHPSLRGALRILPTDCYEGFFLCRMAKHGSTLRTR